MLLKLVFDDGQASGAQHVPLHELVAGLKIAPEPNANEGQIPPCWEEVASLQVPWSLNLAHNWEPCYTALAPVYSSRPWRAYAWMSLQGALPTTARMLQCLSGGAHFG